MADSSVEAPSAEAPSVSAPDASGNIIFSNTEMPDAFLITYAVHSSNSASPSGSVATHTVGRNADGHIYIANSDEAHLFVPESGFYAESGNSRMYTKGDLLSLCEAFTSCLRKSTYILSANPEMIGTEVIFGRTASVCQLTHDIGIYKQTFKLAIDDETGLCLQLVSTSEFLGLSAEENWSSPAHSS